MTDDDLIRRGDALNEVLHYGSIADIAKRIRALPAVQPAPDVSSPDVVHANILRGTIARPTLAQMIHIYGSEAIQNELHMRFGPPAPDVAGLVEAAKIAIGVMECVDGENDCSKGINALEAAIAAWEAVK